MAALALAAGLGVTLGAPLPARAGVEAWRVNEVAVDPGQPQLRWVELYAPPSATADNCFFPGTRLEILDGAGALVGAVQPFNVTVCFAGDTYFLFATSEAAAATGQPADAALPVALGAAGGQVCLRSGALRYDCARWGVVSLPVHDQTGPGDDSVAAPGGLLAGLALERRQDTDVVAADFALDAPTPRGPSDGTPWFPPDAGPVAGVADAGPDAAPEPVADADLDPDAPPPGLPGPDAREGPPLWLNAEPGGGGCDVGGGAAGALLALAAWLIVGSRGRRAGPPA